MRGGPTERASQKWVLIPVSFEFVSLLHGYNSTTTFFYSEASTNFNYIFFSTCCHCVWAFKKYINVKVRTKMCFATVHKYLLGRYINISAKSACADYVVFHYFIHTIFFTPFFFVSIHFTLDSIQWSMNEVRIYFLYNFFFTDVSYLLRIICEYVFI